LFGTGSRGERPPVRRRALGSIARTGAERREHAIEINRCDLHRGMGFGSKFNRDCRYSPRLHKPNPQPDGCGFLLYSFLFGLYGIIFIHIIQRSSSLEDFDKDVLLLVGRKIPVALLFSSLHRLSLHST
jgi:hypothetical protein